ncbi:uncharacterized protein BX664DRAFT_337480 [Halteromyces radiatus]|uniref:uncharacterized protein n=1 Tax=Halteromyces radiatus TaxID=101107 RepID=UPI00221FF28A|nr:uncharacterized protein BX664DRAFT_337480 [Halteromyces radiatus]KAI8084646.1 hypothetical protein BX664DRAFT_337480 [Halteromyces radiatus]
MRFSLISAATLAVVSMVSATPVENSLELSSSHILERDVTSIDGKIFDDSQSLQARGCSGSTWYLTKCGFYCPCGWYYYPQNNCANRRCYDNGHVGCNGRCPKADLRCGTCN